MPVKNSELGKNVTIWHEDLVNIYDSFIGDNTKIGAFVEIGGCEIGNGCTISSHCFLCKGVIVQDDVFFGPGVKTTNVKTPRTFINRKDEFELTLIKRGASIGAGVTIVCGIKIGEYALIGAGAVVTKDVPAYALVYGNPARIHSKVHKNGGVVSKHEYQKRKIQLLF